MVVVRGVDTVRMETERCGSGLRRFGRDRFYWTPDVTRHHHGLEPKRLDSVLEFFNRLGRRMRRNDRDRQQPIRELAKNIGVVLVERPATGAPQLLVGMMNGREPQGWLDDAQVDTGFIEALVKQLR